MQFNKSVSSKPGKVRKSQITASGPERYRMMSSPLSKELQTEHKVKCVPIRKGDEVMVLSGKHRSMTGKVSSVCRATMKVTIEGIDMESRRGEKKAVPFPASKLRVTKLYMNKFREELLKRRAH